MEDTQEMDDRVLELRRAGSSFSSIAKAVGLSGRQAYDAFRRALRHQPPNFRAMLRTEELRRLDTFRMRLEADSDLGDTELARALRAIAQLRQMAVMI